MYPNARPHTGSSVIKGDLTGDACYLRKTIEDMHLPAHVFSREQMLDSLNRLKQLERRGASLVYGHDPEFWQSLNNPILEASL